MVSSRSSSCRGGRQVRGNRGEKDEAAKRLSDRGRIRAAHKYTNYGKTLPPAYNCRESSFYARRTAHASTWSRSPRASNSSPPRIGDLEADRVAVEFEVVPGYAPGDYIKDANLDNVLSQLDESASVLKAGDFVNEAYLPIVVALVKDKSHHETDKAEEWRQVEKDQAVLYVDLDCDQE